MNNRQHLGQTVKNIIVLLSEISSFRVADKAILFEGLDVLAMKRNDSNDLMGMVRAITAFLKGLDNLNTPVIILAMTNLASFFNKALMRCFYAVVYYFNEYLESDLMEIADMVFSEIHHKFRHTNRNAHHLHKILKLKKLLPYREISGNLIRTQLLSVIQKVSNDWLRRFCMQVQPGFSGDKK